jgi:tRNA A-37 threonylcarbamoyl transferase component Bud32
MSASGTNLILSRVGGSRLELRDHTVVKHDSSANAAIEFLKTLQARAIADRTGLFRVPAIIAHDTAAGWIEFERISDATSLQRTLATIDKRKAAVIMRRVARALAAIHRSQTDPYIARSPANDNTLADHPAWNFVHGDFCVTNVLYSTAHDELVLIDWSSAPWLEKTYVYGPPHIDLAVMVISLFLRRPFEADRIPAPAVMMREFLRSYCNDAESKFDPNELRQCVSWLLSRIFSGSRSTENRVRLIACYPSAWSAQRAVDKFVTEL